MGEHDDNKKEIMFYEKNMTLIKINMNIFKKPPKFKFVYFLPIFAQTSLLNEKKMLVAVDF